jgi:hypothetical protein
MRSASWCPHSRAADLTEASRFPRGRESDSTCWLGVGPPAWRELIRWIYGTSGTAEGAVLEFQLVFVAGEHDMGGFIRQGPHPSVPAFRDAARFRRRSSLHEGGAELYLADNRRERVSPPSQIGVLQQIDPERMSKNSRGMSADAPGAVLRARNVGVRGR